LLSILICNSISASAAVVTNTIENKIIQEITYPLQIDTCLIENNESNELKTQLKFILKTDFKEYDHFAKDLYHYQTKEHLLP